MNRENRILNEPAETVYISTEKYSYGIFCYNSSGDLFLNSDWGFYGFAWRAYGDNFKDFLSNCNADYIVGKFDTNMRYLHSKGMPKHAVKPLTQLVEEFINFLKTSK